MYNKTNSGRVGMRPEGWLSTQEWGSELGECEEKTGKGTREVVNSR